MQKSGELDKIRNKGTPVPNVPGIYEVTVNTYGTSYENAVGLGNCTMIQLGLLVILTGGILIPNLGINDP